MAKQVCGTRHATRYAAVGGMAALVAVVLSVGLATGQTSGDDQQRPGGPGGPAQMCAANGFVYILAGPTLYQFDGTSLALKNQVDLPKPQPPANNNNNGQTVQLPNTQGNQGGATKGGQQQTPPANQGGATKGGQQTLPNGNQGGATKGAQGTGPRGL
jgi:hypothetical protein